MLANRDTFCVEILNYQIMKAHTHNLSNMKIKTFILTVLVLLSGSACKAQYNQYNSFMRKALVIYKCGPDGYYHATKNVTLDEVKDVETQYAYNKKTQNLYVLTPNSNCEVTLTKEYAKIFKKSKNIRLLKDEELETAIEEQNRILEQKFKRLNDERTRHIEDSIAKAKRDSIERARQDSIARVREAEQLQSYRETHDWRRVPVKGIRLKCEICDETIINEDSLYCIGINNDSIMYFEWKEGKLDNEYLEWHISSLPMELKTNPSFKYHFDAYSDSLTNMEVSSRTAKGLCAMSFYKYLDKLEKEAPYGFFEDWGWSNEYSMVTFHFSYTNMNKSTIKYIAVYFKITNDVGDVRKTGYFQGTGPVEEYGTGSWEWDSSPYFVSGDASTMEFTKVVITYTNGKQKVLSKNQIMYN